MRYYEIAIVKFGTNLPITNPRTGNPLMWTSTKVGPYGQQKIDGAQNVEMDMPITTQDAPSGNAWIRIWGVPINDINMALQLAGNNIIVRGGMQQGLPLSKPAQQGVLMNGYIVQAFANWIGLDMTLDLFCCGSPAPVGTSKNPINLAGSWNKGQQLSDMLAARFRQAFGTSMTWVIDISQNLVLDHDAPDKSGSLNELATFVNNASRQIMNNPSYPGIKILVDQGVIKVFDAQTTSAAIIANSKSSPFAVAFQDLIGQPTWIDAATVQFKCPMRGDIKMPNYVTLPKGLQTATQGSALGLVGNAAQDTTAFTGTMQITQVRHVGNFRQPSADAWVTVFNAVYA